MRSITNGLALPPLQEILLADASYVFVAYKDASCARASHLQVLFSRLSESLLKNILELSHSLQIGGIKTLRVSVIR